ncbi:MAG: SLBB domain-containing protein [Verrucomicrobiota bacterium]
MRLILAFAVFMGLFQTASAQAVIEKNSKLEISIQGVPPSDATRINSTYPVDNSGNIQMWEIGAVRAAGLQPSSLARKIEAAYRNAQIYTSPVIQIQTQSKADDLLEVVTVTGKVKKPGDVPWQVGMTLMQAIAAAGGPDTFGTTKRVDVYREGKKYRLNPLESDKEKLEPVFPGDTIEIDQVKAWEKGGQ